MYTFSRHALYIHCIICLLPDTWLYFLHIVANPHWGLDLGHCSVSFDEGPLADTGVGKTILPTTGGCWQCSEDGNWGSIAFLPYLKKVEILMNRRAIKRRRKWRAKGTGNAVARKAPFLCRQEAASRCAAGISQHVLLWIRPEPQDRL